MLNVPLRRIGLGGMFVLSMAGLALLGCDSLKPSADRDNGSTVSVAFDPTVLGDLATHMKTLQIRVSKVVNDQVQPQESADRRLPIEMQKKEYSIDKISIGLKEIEISILNESDLALGTGKVRVLVKPGINKTDPVIIKIKKINNPVTNITASFTIKGDIGGQSISDVVKRAEFSWKTEASAQNGIALLTRGSDSEGQAGISYLDIKPVLEENCTSCHKETLAKAKLKVDRFPFQSELIVSEADLMKEIMLRIQDEDGPMPPSDIMEADKLDLFKKWEANGFAAGSIATGSNSFSVNLTDVRVSDKLIGQVIFYGENDLKLGEKEIAPYSIEENGTFSQELEISLPAPLVNIPIVVEVE